MNIKRHNLPRLSRFFQEATAIFYCDFLKALIITEKVIVTTRLDRQLHTILRVLFEFLARRVYTYI